MAGGQVEPAPGVEGDLSIGQLEMQTAELRVSAARVGEEREGEHLGTRRRRQHGRRFRGDRDEAGAGGFERRTGPLHRPQGQVAIGAPAAPEEAEDQRAARQESLAAHDGPACVRKREIRQRVA
jgi:hypothetical protein